MCVCVCVCVCVCTEGNKAAFNVLGSKSPRGGKPLGGPSPIMMSEVNAAPVWVTGLQSRNKASRHRTTDSHRVFWSARFTACQRAEQRAARQRAEAACASGPACARRRDRCRSSLDSVSLLLAHGPSE
jgi:hypothetical protein